MSMEVIDNISTVRSIRVAQEHFASIVAAVCNGRSVVVYDAGKPVVKVVQYTMPTQHRQPGALKGKITIADDFNEDDQSLIDSFEHSEVFP